MKALLQKDIYESVTSMRAVFLVILIFTVVSLLTPASSIIIPYLVILPGTMVATILNLEEQNGWMVYAGTLPVRRRTQVMEKYLYGALLVALGSLLALLIQWTYIFRGQAEFQPAASFLSFLSIGLMAPALLLPFVYWLGAEKGRYITMFLVIGIVMLVLTQSRDGGMILPASVPVGAVFPACIVIYMVSMFLSMRIYEKKELTR